MINIIGPQVQEYINNNNNINRKIEDVIVTLNRQVNKVNESLKGEVQQKSNDALVEAIKELKEYIEIRNSVIPILEETVYWEKEYKRRDDSKKE